MTPTKRRFFSGNTLEQAVMAAASFYELEPDRLGYRQIEKKHGFLRVRRNVVIEVDPENPLRATPTEAPEPATQDSGPQAAAEPVEEPGEEPGEESGDESGDEPWASADSEEEEDDDDDRQPFFDGPADPPQPSAEPADREARPASQRGQGGRRGDSRDGGRDRGRGGRGRGGRGRGRDGGRGRAGGRDRRDGAPRAESKPAERRPQEPFEPTPEMLKAAVEAVDRLAQLARLRVAAEVREGEDRLELDLSGPDQERLISEDGEVLLALEQLVPRVVRGLIGASAPVRLDCDGFREEAEASLRAQARFAAEEVQRTGRETVLDPMTPAERRIIHIALSEDRTVETESEGDGYFKRVTVRPL